MKKLLTTASIVLMFATSAFTQTLDFFKEVNQSYSLLGSFWGTQFKRGNLKFNNPSKIIYSTENPVNSACGIIQEKNAALCTGDNTIYISKDLFQELAQKYNNGVFYFIIAHEYGHSIQEQLQIERVLTFDREQQADCLAGVFFNALSHYNLVENKDITNINNFFKDTSKKDNFFSNITSDESHGNSEQRFAAFNYGYKIGNTDQCFKNFNIGNQGKEIANDLIKLFKKQ